MTRSIRLAAAAALCLASSAWAQSVPYGAPISLDNARKCLAAAEAESRKNTWNVVIYVLDSGGHLVQAVRMDGTQFGFDAGARDKAWSAVAYKRSTKPFEDALAGGNPDLRILALKGMVPSEGGLPIVMGGALVGGVGVSGVTATQNGQIAGACVAALR